MALKTHKFRSFDGSWNYRDKRGMFVDCQCAECKKKRRQGIFASVDLELPSFYKGTKK